MADPLCDKCGKPVKDGDARYTAGEPKRYRHADCHDWRSPKVIFGEALASLARARRQLEGIKRNFDPIEDSR